MVDNRSNVEILVAPTSLACLEQRPFPKNGTEITLQAKYLLTESGSHFGGKKCGLTNVAACVNYILVLFSYEKALKAYPFCTYFVF